MSELETAVHLSSAHRCSTYPAPFDLLQQLCVGAMGGQTAMVHDGVARQRPICHQQGTRDTTTAAPQFGSSLERYSRTGKLNWPTQKQKPSIPSAQPSLEFASAWLPPASEHDL